MCHAGARNKYEYFDVWFEANGPELIELDEILDKFCEASRVDQPFTIVHAYYGKLDDPVYHNKTVVLK